jgi:hypothetical protein
MMARRYLSVCVEHTDIVVVRIKLSTGLPMQPISITGACRYVLSELILKWLSNVHMLYDASVKSVENYLMLILEYIGTIFEKS